LFSNQVTKIILNKHKEVFNKALQKNKKRLGILAINAGKIMRIKKGDLKRSP